MEKFFNTAGPIKSDMNYYISSFDRLNFDEIKNLICKERYFVLHAPRQTGKTSALFEMMDRINSEGIYDCLYVNIESAQASRGDVGSGIRTVCESIGRASFIYLQNRTLREWVMDNKNRIEPQKLLFIMLEEWAITNPKPIVLFLDEVDALVGDTLISLLRQIRSGYNQRPNAFPQSIVLCGVRDVRDYRIHTKNNEIITGGSAFNIKAKSLRLGNFTYEESKRLWLQHTTQTGQEFEETIFPKLWSDTKGQPWLVNALAYEVTWENESLRDRAKKITLKHYIQARERLIYNRDTHLDQLIDKLQEPRVHQIISSILQGNDIEIKKVKLDDLQYVVDLGLITSKPKISIANDIYKETIPRELTYTTQVQIANQDILWYLKEDNSIDMPKLLKAFQQFFRENADSWIEIFDYKEAGSQLLLQAFLQRIINGGGRINREYGLGRKRTDIFIEYPLDKELGFFGEKIQRVVIETKILYSNLDKTIEKGLEQTLEYVDFVGADEAHLIIFNRDKGMKWEKKIWNKEMSYEGRKVLVWGA